MIETQNIYLLHNCGFSFGILLEPRRLRKRR